MIPPDLENWLETAGYEHYVFLSYPRAPEAAAMKCALAIANAIRQRLADFTAAPPCRLVFVDHECIVAGENWQAKLQHSLCRSVILIAVCAPIYYRREHAWCGQEYQAMLSLSELRRVGAVIPLIVRKFPNYPLPPAVANLQSFDLVDEATKDPNFAKRRRFISIIDQLIDSLVRVGTALRDHSIVAHPVPQEFRFPQVSAFEDYNHPTQAAPLRPSK